jgi:DNA (cytosine-5)-methyltransferase 1
MSKKLKVLSLFSGIGAYEKALSNLGIDFDLIGYCEIDENASKCYSYIHQVDESKNLKDVKAVADNPAVLEDFDLLTFSPPCQDISTAGKHAGINENTRTGLMWEVVKIIEAKKPKYLVMENVKNLNGRYKPVLDAYIAGLEELGYKCASAVLNAKNYGTPQNRERLFMVARLDEQPKLPEPNPDAMRDMSEYLDVPGKVQRRKTDAKPCVAYTVRVGGRKSKIGNKHNWDGYYVDGKEHFLTAKECLKLMGFTDSDYKVLADNDMSETAIAKVAGNSVVVSVLEAVFKELL